MKKLNKVSFIVLFAIFSFAFTQNTFAGDFLRKIISNNNTNHDCNPNPGSVGAPLDGGLLSILGAAGLGYFLMRKKNKKQDQE